jgi:hypothetical protein
LGVQVLASRILVWRNSFREIKEPRAIFRWFLALITPANAGAGKDITLLAADASSRRHHPSNTKKNSPVIHWLTFNAILRNKIGRESFNVLPRRQYEILQK